MTDPARTYAMLAKPVSGACNLRCAYCYYAGKETLLGQGAGRMSHEVLEAYIEQSLAMHGRDAVVEFAWHGGEPILAGLSFYEEAVRLERKHGRGRLVRNSMQTNATLLTDAWCRFFRDNDFAIGVSIDGPEALHNACRKGADGSGSFEAVMAGVRLLERHRVPFAALTTVNRFNMEHPLEVYRFLRELTDYIQFLPVVEALPTALCVHDPLCGHSGCVEANGDIYACDRYAFPAYRLGNLTRRPLGELMEENRAFGMHKTCGLPQECLDCPYVRLCFGGCPKDRLSGGRNYLCDGYRRFFARVVADWNAGG